MQELKRRKPIVEQLKIGAEVLTITIKPWEIAMKYQRALADVIKMRDKISNDMSADILEQYGAVIVRLLGVVLGQKNTEKILEFYENNYDEMSTEVMEYVATVIKPRLDAAITDMRQRTRESYKKAKYGTKWNLGGRTK